MNRFWKRPSHAIRNRKSGFTLLELLAASTILIFLLALLLTIVSQSSRIWQSSESAKSRRQTARILLEMISRDLEAALFPLLPSGSGPGPQFLLNPPSVDASVLNRDAAFWQAALPGRGDRGDLYEVGYFVRWSQDSEGAHGVLCRLQVPASAADSLFQNPTAPWLTPAKLDTYAPGLADTTAHRGLLAENVLALWITLSDKDGNTSGFAPSYDSRAAAVRPAFAEVAIVLCDARTAQLIKAPQDITAHYTAASVEAFVDGLPPEIRRGTEIFKIRVSLETAR